MDDIKDLEDVDYPSDASWVPLDTELVNIVKSIQQKGHSQTSFTNLSH